MQYDGKQQTFFAAHVIAHDYFRHFEVAAAAHRQKFCKTLYDAQDNRFEKTHKTYCKLFSGFLKPGLRFRMA